MENVGKKQKTDCSLHYIGSLSKAWAGEKELNPFALDILLALKTNGNKRYVNHCCNCLILSGS